ncbi:hypothetical protein LQ944_00220 [Staphylococcus pasteuri]|nr:hypothetical protein [Staphylococcus pasteuri]MCD9065550.1 hypothetical protein [Staphylococcus pasteuri]WAE42019.1 hypothetical protein LQ944_00220 [Staphylococcus pasteuri]
MIIKLLEYPVWVALIIPGVLKKFRMWHLGYLDRKPKI